MVNYTSGTHGISHVTYTSGNTGTVGGGGDGGGAYYAYPEGQRWAGQRTPGSAYVTGAIPACRKYGCQAPELAELCRRISDQQHELFDVLRAKEEQMEPTRALWCEQSGHSFSEKDPDFKVMSITGKDEDGKPVSESRTICGPCAVKTQMTLGSTRNVPAPAAELRAGE